MIFEWENEKAERSQKKHGVSFSEAATVFGDPLAMTFSDPDHSVGEHRFLTFGTTVAGTAVVVVHTDRDDIIRIISTRTMTRREKVMYEEGN